MRAAVFQAVSRFIGGAYSMVGPLRPHGGMLPRQRGESEASQQNRIRSPRPPTDQAGRRLRLGV